jgi:hypothetical protein
LIRFPQYATPRLEGVNRAGSAGQPAEKNKAIRRRYFWVTKKHATNAACQGRRNVKEAANWPAVVDAVNEW